MKYFVIIFVVLCASVYAADTTKRCVDCSDKEETVLILHKGDPFPPKDTLYSYDSVETEKDFDRRRKELQELRDKQKYKCELIEIKADVKCKTR